MQSTMNDLVFLHIYPDKAYLSSYDSDLMLFGFCLGRPSPTRQQCTNLVLQIRTHLFSVECLLVPNKLTNLGDWEPHKMRVFPL